MRTHRPFALALAASLAAACGTGPAGPGSDPANPEPGATRFVSADETMGTNANAPGRGADDDLGAGAPADDEGGENGGGDRTVEEGDVYRVLSGGTLLNLNAYRGLQVIDVSNPTRPAVIGRLEVSGTPVELYVSGTTAYVLLNDWVGYWGSREDIRVNTTEGGVVVTVDLSDPAHPVVRDREVVPGWIYKSRLTRGDGQDALFVVSQEYGYVSGANGSSTWQTSTKVKSFAAGATGLTPVDELDLGGWIADIAATPEALLVARYDWYTGNGDRSRVSIIDISSPDGSMIEGDEIETAGLVENQFNMDLDGNVLRVVSGRGWNGSNANHLQTFDATDISNLVPIDHDTFGTNQDLYGTIFLGNSAFFVTYERTDPFHAFQIDANGQAQEMSQFVVSGWNDFFRPVFANTRLIGIGTNDTSGRAMAVSLYDVTDLANPNPLVARQEVDVDWSWSAASWDHRAFTVLENAVSIPSGDGTATETGLVLLPFTGYDQQTGATTAAVQIFTFSNTTLTRRGLMNHGTPVHRSFESGTATTANLSQEELSLFATGNPDQPQEIGRLDLAPNYTDVLVYGSYGVRLKDAEDWYTRYYGGNVAARPSTVQVIPRNAHPDMATPVASFEVPAGSFLKKVGNLLTAITMTPVDTAQWPYVWETTIRVFDLADPAHPAARGEVTTRELEPDYGGYYGYYGAPEMADCFDCGGYWYPWAYGNGGSIYAVGQSLAFVERTQEQESLGQERVCYAYPTNDRSSCYGANGYTDGCTINGGGETCVTRNGATTCSGEFYACTWDAEGNSFDCQPTELTGSQVQRNCYDREAMRYWNRFAVQVVDLSQPATPVVGAEMQMPREEEAVGVVTHGNDLWLSYREPTQVPGDPRPYVAYYAREIDLGTPSHPVQGPEINVPGELLAVNGNTLFTRDQVWGQRSIEAAVARLRLQGNQAVLEAHRRFADQLVETIKLDGAGHVLVSHREGSGYGWYGGGQVSQELTILDANSSTLAQLASVEVDSWATLRDARAGRALFQVPGGLLVFNLDNVSQPWPQAFFATKGWPTDFLVDGRSILFAAGRYGLYQFGLDEVNLQQAP